MSNIERHVLPQKENKISYVTAEEAIQQNVGYGMRIWISEGTTPAKTLKALYKVTREGKIDPQNSVYRLPVGSDDATTILLHGLIVRNVEEITTFPQDGIEFAPLFISRNVRSAAQKGDVSPILVNLGSGPRLIKNGTLPIDCTMVSLSPPDKEGFCTLGTSVACTRTVIDKAIQQRKEGNPQRIRVIAEINERVPRTTGNTKIHINNLDAAVLSHEPITIKTQEDYPPLSLKETAIAKHVAKLVEDGATLQIGIGRLPDAILSQLGNKKNLAIFTEIFTDGVRPLVESGAVTGPVEASFAFGTQKLYDWIGRNPNKINFYGTERMNNPMIIAEQPKMTAINAAIEVDLTGQVCADSIGTKPVSGAGGQYDFIEGASQSDNGKAIIILPSEILKKDQGKSTIVSTLAEGAGVVTTRNIVQWIATEFGAVNLEGKRKSERALLLIAIAHPLYWNDLITKAKDMHIFKESDTVDSLTIYKIWQQNVVKDETIDFGELLAL